MVQAYVIPTDGGEARGAATALRDATGGVPGITRPLTCSVVDW